jgi:hypothetical protein
MTKKDYEKVASIINTTLRQYYKDDTLKPQVIVTDTRHMGAYCDRWSLVVNDDLFDLLQRSGLAQNLFYADEIYTVGDNDLYIEPYNKTLFNLAVL